VLLTTGRGGRLDDGDRFLAVVHFCKRIFNDVATSSKESTMPARGSQGEGRSSLVYTNKRECLDHRHSW
jgi:hypothetical protein